MELVCNNKVPCPGTMTGHEGGPRRRATPCADRSQQSFWKLPTRVLLVESSEESIVSTRISATVVIVLGGMLVVGCQPSKETTPNPQQSVSRVNNPVMADVTVDLVKAKLGADFTVQDEGPPLVLVRTLDPHEILVFVTHNSEGKVEHVSAHVAGPKDAVEKIDELYDGIVKSVAQAVGVTNLEALSAYADIGLTYTQMNFPYGFRLDQRYFDMLPNVPVDPRSTLIKYRENFVQRDLQVLPDLSSRRNAKPPIPGASMEQLGKLLAGFTVKAKIDGQVMLYTRDQPTARARLRISRPLPAKCRGTRTSRKSITSCGWSWPVSSTRIVTRRRLPSSLRGPRSITPWVPVRRWVAPRISCRLSTTASAGGWQFMPAIDPQSRREEWNIRTSKVKRHTRREEWDGDASGNAYWSGAGREPHDSRLFRRHLHLAMSGVVGRIAGAATVPGKPFPFFRGTRFLP
jgi:hypothetical protein